MRKCPSCKKEVADGFVFCSSCGARIDNICASCGSPLLAEDVFCGKCGKSITAVPLKNKANKRRRLFIVAISLIVFFLIILFLLPFFGDKLIDHIPAYTIKNEVVIDNKTGLMWQRTRADDTMNHNDAIEYCKDLSLGGYSDWRLPSISELKTLIVGCQSGTDACKVSDDCLSSNCYSGSCQCAGIKGPGEGGYYWQKSVWQGVGRRPYFWSSSVLSGDSSGAWGVGFDFGSVDYMYHRNKDNDVRCVRYNK